MAIKATCNLHDRISKRATTFLSAYRESSAIIAEFSAALKSRLRLRNRLGQCHHWLRSARSTARKQEMVLDTSSIINARACDSYEMLPSENVSDHVGQNRFHFWPISSADKFPELHVRAYRHLRYAWRRRGHSDRINRPALLRDSTRRDGRHPSHAAIATPKSQLLSVGEISALFAGAAIEAVELLRPGTTGISLNASPSWRGLLDVELSAVGASRH